MEKPLGPFLIFSWHLVRFHGKAQFLNDDDIIITSWKHVNWLKRESKGKIETRKNTVDFRCFLGCGLATVFVLGNEKFTRWSMLCTVLRLFTACRLGTWKSCVSMAWNGDHDVMTVLMLLLSNCCPHGLCATAKQPGIADSWASTQTLASL